MAERVQREEERRAKQVAEAEAGTVAPGGGGRKDADGAMEETPFPGEREQREDLR